jgi:hypothetical protein
VHALKRFAVTVVGVGLLLVGAAMMVLPGPGIVPLWSPATGGILAVTALILLTTTYLTLRAARGEDTTHTGETFRRGSVRISA